MEGLLVGVGLPHSGAFHIDMSFMLDSCVSGFAICLSNTRGLFLDGYKHASRQCCYVAQWMLNHRVLP